METNKMVIKREIKRSVALYEEHLDAWQYLIDTGGLQEFCDGHKRDPQILIEEGLVEATTVDLKGN